MMKTRRVRYVKNLLLECYRADKDLVSKWHQANGVADCVAYEAHAIKANDVRVFKVILSGELVGYFGQELGLELPCLTSFFIMPKFREEKFKNQFWSVIMDYFKGPFFCGLYDKNIPANKFIQKRGGTVVKQRRLLDGEASLYKVGA